MAKKARTTTAKPADAFTAHKIEAYRKALQVIDTQLAYLMRTKFPRIQIESMSAAAARDAYSHLILVAPKDILVTFENFIFEKRVGNPVVALCELRNAMRQDLGGEAFEFNEDYCFFGGGPAYHGDE